MTTNLDAIYENGTFRPVGEVALPLVNGTRVRFRVEATQEAETASSQPKKGNGLAALAGGWTDQQWKNFEATVADAEQVDEAFWQ